MLLDFILLLIGLTILYFGAEWLVTAASKLAFNLGISPLIIGLTVVAFGTSAPELVVTATASWQNASELSLGNVVGSNVCNIALILGIAALLKPLHVDPASLRRDYPIMLLSSIALYIMAWTDGKISRLEGALLFIALLAYTFRMIYSVRKSRAQQRKDSDDKPKKHLHDIGMLVVGFAGLIFGAQLMVDSAISIARSFGISEFVIAVSVVAFGTSVPELATSAVAAIKDESDIGVGNVIGSNIFNVLMVIGLVALVFELPVESRSLSFDFPIMLGISIILFPILRTGLFVGRIKGALLLGGYLSYVIALFLFR